MSNIFFGKTNLDCQEGIIEKLKQNYFADPNSNHLVIVPDRISVLTEVKIFDRLNIQSTCNIRVLTLSRLASIVMEGGNVIPKTTSCMIFQKLLKDNKQDLKCFNKKIDIDLAQTLFETVSQFKSCRIPVDQICVTTKNKILEDKLSDIALLYDKYQKHLSANGLIDSLDRLDFVKDKIKDNDFIKSSYIYISNFDSFTFQGFQIISAIMKHCKQFNIGLAKTDSAVKSHIYDDEFCDNVLKLFQINNIEPQVVFCKENTAGQFKYMQDFLFGFNSYPLKVKKSDIELFEGANFEEEVLFCASKIKQLIVENNYKFGDFVIAVAGLQKKSSVIERIFKDYNFNYFIDSAVNFKDSCLVRLVSQLVDVFVENFSRVSVISFLKNQLLGLQKDLIEDFEDYLIKYNINDVYLLKASNISSCKFYENFNTVRQTLFSMVEPIFAGLEKAKNYNDFLTIFENFLLNINAQEKLMDFANKYTLQGNIKQAKLFEQYYSNLVKIFDDLKQVLGEEECDLKLFYSTLLSGVNATKISTTPISTNSMFIGDCSLSFFDKTKVYFVLGADEKNFPFTLNDCGLISDKEINALSDNYKLEPSIAQINLKERFKVYELLLKPTDKLFLSYNYGSAALAKSKILSDISQMFIEENSKGGFNILPFKNYNDLEFLTINNNYKTARNNLISGLRNYYDGQEVNTKKLNSLLGAVEKKDEVNLSLFDFKNDISLKQNYFFLKNTVSVSQVESFMTCPFLHFVRYGLKLKEKDEGELSSLNIGTILHDVAKIFVDNNKLPILDSEVKQKAKLAFETVLEKEVFESVKNNNFNKVLIKNLLNEAIRFCGVLNYQAKYSSFKTLATEIRFDDKNLIKSFKIRINNHLLKLVGQVDRIDKFEDYFRIIDYKTGKCDTSLKELFFGKKVQLEAYLKVVENSLKLKPAGCYYLPVKSGFADEKTTLAAKYQLKGKTLKEDGIINASDNRLEIDELKSDIVEVKFNKNDAEKRTLSAYAKVVDFNTLKNFSDYAIELISTACKDILKLNITPNPLVLGSDDPCKNCKHFALCRFDENLKNFKRSPQIKIEESHFDVKGEE